MRRALFALLLILSFVAAPRAFGQAADAQQPAPAAQLRAIARKLMASGNVDDAAKAADLLAKASSIDAQDAATLKAEAQTRQLNAPTSEGGWKVLVDITPFLSFVIVALGFFVNSAQARTAEREKREEAARQQKADAEKAARDQQAAEEERWSQAVALIQKSEDFSPAAAILSTFQTTAHAALARSTAVTVMLNAKKFSNFSDLFNTFMEPVTPANLPQVLAMLRSVSITLAPLISKAWVNGQVDTSPLTAAEVESYALLLRERSFLGAKAAPLLRQPRAPGEVMDLSDIGLDNIDLSGADLRGFMAPYIWNYVNLDGADLRGMRNIDNSWPFLTAWWHAGHIDADFLALLVERAPFDPAQAINTNRGKSAQDYRAAVARLRAQVASIPN